MRWFAMSRSQFEVLGRANSIDSLLGFRNDNAAKGRRPSGRCCRNVVTTVTISTRSVGEIIEPCVGFRQLFYQRGLSHEFSAIDTTDHDGRKLT